MTDHLTFAKLEKLQIHGDIKVLGPEQLKRVKPPNRTETGTFRKMMAHYLRVLKLHMTYDPLIPLYVCYFYTHTTGNVYKHVHCLSKYPE